MLRRHNPGLASKVRLDDKGRLKVFNVDEATRKWEKRERHRRRQKLRGKREIHGLTIFQASRAAMVNTTLPKRWSQTRSATVAIAGSTTVQGVLLYAKIDIPEYCGVFH